MATYGNLPVYKQTYDLLLHFFRVSQNMERDYKFTIGESLKKEIIELIVNVYRANCQTSKVALIEAARENTEVIRLMLRLLHDLKQISLKEFVYSNGMLESVSKQLSAWHRSRINKSNGVERDVFEGQSSEGLFAFQESAG